MRHGRRIRTERGQAAGAEVVALGVLVLVGGLLVGVNAWSVFWTRAGADAVAREYLRAATEADDAAAAAARGRAAADAVMAARGLDQGRVQIHVGGEFVACAEASVEVTISVPVIRAPFLGSLGSSTVTVEHAERVDAYRAGPALAGGPGPPCGAP